MLGFRYHQVLRDEGLHFIFIGVTHRLQERWSRFIKRASLGLLVYFDFSLNVPEAKDVS